MSDIGARIAEFFAWLSTIVPAFVTPDWAALIGLLPLFLAPLLGLVPLLLKIFPFIPAHASTERDLRIKNG